MTREEAITAADDALATAYNVALAAAYNVALAAADAYDAEMARIEIEYPQ
jgi:hypothetical protein